ncbi:MAG TPA: LysR family transcriptional regulator, partial [Vineibacter sp.]|nr:LysR family transcriptional regulator [Vineibacter sp.]
MRSLNLDQLRTLIEVIELGSFTAAARQLSLSQPAISLQVRELEQRVGVRLVERVGRTLRATAAGRLLAERGKGILADCEATIVALRAFQSGSTGRVRIAATSTALTCLLPPIVWQLRAQHPGIDLLVNNMPSGDTVEQVARNLVDMGLVTLPVEDQRLRVTPLRSLTLVAVLPSGTPDIPDAVTPDYAARQTLVLGPARGAVNGLILRWLAGRLPLPQPAMHVDTVDAMW